LPNLVNADKLDSVIGSFPVLFDFLTVITSLVGIIPITAGFIVGVALLFKKMRYNQRAEKQEIKIEKKQKKKRFSLNINFKKPIFKKKEIEEKLDSLGMTEKQSERFEELVKKNEQDVITSNNIDKVLDRLDQQKDKEIGGFVLPDDIDSVREEVKEPIKVDLEKLEDEMKEKGHSVEKTDGQIEITENPKVEVTEKKSAEQAVNELVDESSEIMENELDSALDEDFNPTPEDVKETQNNFNLKENQTHDDNGVCINHKPEDCLIAKQAPPTEDEILEVQQLIKEGLTQDEAISKVVRKKQSEIVEIVEEIPQTDESIKIKEMENERDIFKLDDPKKKKSPLSLKFEQSSLGQKFINKKKEQAKKDAKKFHVLTDLGHQRMIEYAGKIEEKMIDWSKEQNLNDKAMKDLKNFSLFASMCEMLADKKTTKKKYWTVFKKN